MEQSKGFVASGQEHLVFRQWYKKWYKKFNDFIQSVGFSKSDEDHCLFTKTTQVGTESHREDNHPQLY